MGRDPREPLPRLFLRFLRFGALAWGGPVAQIAMIRRELVDEVRWVSSDRFNRVLALYQVLPGPEAHELCVYFGTLARGRIGGVLAGLGFMLPGLLLILGLSWAYLNLDFASTPIRGIFAGFQAAVLAVIVRAVHRIAAHALQQLWLAGIAGLAFVATLAGINFLPTLFAAGLMYALAARGQGRTAVGLATVLMVLAVWYSLAISRGTEIAVGARAPELGQSPGQAMTWELLLTGLKAGLLTFGGAYTAIPFVRQDAVGNGWMSDSQFLDGLALSGIIPAPLIIFCTFVGYFAGGLPGAVAITATAFLPAFLFSLVGYRYMERLIAARSISAFLDGTTAGVVGLMAATTVELFRAGVTNVPAFAVFLAALLTLYSWRAKAAVAVVVLAGGALGLVLVARI